VVGPSDELWDDAIIVEYPSFSSLQKLFEKPEFSALPSTELPPLEDSRLIAAIGESIPRPLENR
jgi:hypothetical protein